VVALRQKPRFSKPFTIFGPDLKLQRFSSTKMDALIALQVATGPANQRCDELQKAGFHTPASSHQVFKRANQTIQHEIQMSSLM
jgi:hypothetical protein